MWKVCEICCNSKHDSTDPDSRRFRQRSAVLDCYAVANIVTCRELANQLQSLIFVPTASLLGQKDLTWRLWQGSLLRDVRFQRVLGKFPNLI
jgi:hypothetical protein